MRLVTKEMLSASLNELRRSSEPTEGLYGPDSEVWRKYSESVVFAGSGRAALLQLAHPAVAQAIDVFSITKRDRLARFRQTFFYVFSMMFGDLKTALSMAERVHKMHQKVRGTIEDIDAGPRFLKGTHYAANDAEYLLWVAASLFESAAWVYQNLVRPLKSEDQDRLLLEFRRFTKLFGIPSDMLPRTWGEFEDYNRHMWSSDVLTVSSTARSLKTHLCTPPTVALKPFWDWYVTFTAGALPSRVRVGFQMPYGVREAMVYKTSLRAIRGVRLMLPEHLRRLPVYHRALCRVRGEPEGRLDMALDRLVFGMLAKVG